MKLILASTSPYRKNLLAKLEMPFECMPPNTTEDPTPGEQPQAMAERLAIEKATAVAARINDGWVIGSDQVASLHGDIMHKPLTLPKAQQQLSACSGNRVNFYTGLCLINLATGQRASCVDKVQVHFKTLSAAHIETYLRKEQPFDCAGSFKAEGLGILLFDSIQSEDPNSLIGLPLIKLSQLFKQLGVDLLDQL